MDKYLLYASCILFCLSCSSLTSKEAIEIDSLPIGAQVEVLNPVNSQFIVLGKTPLKVKPSDIKKTLSKDYEFMAIKVSSEGYVVENIIIDTKLRKHVAYRANLKKVEAWNDKTNEVSSLVANQLTLQVQDINQEIIRKDFQKALTKTQALLEQYPKAHVYYDMKASILFLMGKKNDSLASYNKSLILNPDNAKSQEMVKRIKEMKWDHRLLDYS